jgi:hypothetical protein
MSFVRRCQKPEFLRNFEAFFYFKPAETTFLAAAGVFAIYR